MDRSQKQQIAAALHQDLAETVCVVVTHQTGLSVDEVTQLRRQMRSAGARYRVTKNRLVTRDLDFPLPGTVARPPGLRRRLQPRR